MSTIRITKRFSFEAGHALYGYDGKCKNVHGHSYKLYVTVIGSPITDTSNVKVKLRFEGNGSCDVLGQTNSSKTGMSFIRLGDT